MKTLLKTSKITGLIWVLLLLAVLKPTDTRAAVWQSNATGYWNSAATWTLISGVPAASYPTANDVVTITTHSVNVFASANCQALTINGTGTLTISGGQSVVISGNFTGSGVMFSSGNATIYFATSSGNSTITHTGTMSGTFNLNFRPYGRIITIAAATIFSNIVQVYCEGLGYAGSTVNNQGTISVTSLFQCLSSGTFNNSTGGSLTLRCNVTQSGGGVFSATGNPNTVNFTGTGWSVVPGTTYHHLSIAHSGASVTNKFLVGHATINGDFTIASNVQLNAQNYNVTIGGTWINNCSTFSTTGLGGTFTFSGATPSIRRLTNQETLGNVVVNCTGSFTPNSSLTAGYTGNFSCSSLTLTGGTLDLNSTANYTVSVTGNVTGNGGILNGRNGLINFTGTAAQTINGGTPITFSNIRAANAAGVSTSTAHNMSGTLTVASGSFTSATADFTLLSSATTGVTARIAALTSGSVAGARWVVQRRITTGAPSTTTPYWGDYSSPMSGSTLTDWDNEMYMSGVAGADGTACCPTFYSVQQWNNGGGNYSNVTSQIPLVRGLGYSCWTASDLSTFNAFTFDTRGTLNTGSIPVATPAADYYLLGNPYPSQVLFSALTRVGIGNYFWILDESLQDYAYWDGSVGTGKLAGTGGVINSSQGFLVESTGGGSLTFDETDKSATNVVFVREAAPVNLVRFHFNNNAGRQVGMENMIHFVEGANNEKDLMDMGFPKAPFLKNRYEVKTLTLNGKELCKNTLNSSDPKQEVPVVFKAAEAGNYSLSIDGISNLAGYTCVVLEDMSTGTFVDLSNKKSYSFDCYDNLERHFVLHFTKGKESISCVETSKVFASIGENTQIASNVYMIENGISVLFTNQDVKTTSVTVYNSVGQLVSSEQYVGGGEFIAKRPSEAGIYFVILARDGKTETHKLSVN